MYYTYILKSLESGRYYKGITNNLDRRMNQHLNGEVATTKYQSPLILIHVELCISRQEARSLEKYFKSGFGREIIKEIDTF